MERKLVTVLFADAIGSTSLGDRLDPERLRSVLDAYFDAMGAAVAEWGGTVEKFIGDAVMAVFGVPAVREDDAERALNAAIEMMQRLGLLNKELQARHGLTLQMRIGVNSGEVVAGEPSDSSQRLVSGDPVNVAARLQAEAEPDTILVGDRTYLAARQAFEFGDRIELRLKGKPTGVGSRRLLARVPEAIRGVPGLTSPLVGRTAELLALTSQLDEVVDSRRPKMVTVLGPAGVGKSRLVREFVAAVRERHPGARILRGRCLAAGHGITYWALGEILRAACDIHLDDTAAVAAAKLKSAVSDERTVAALAATAGIPLPDSRIMQMSPQSVADELAWAWPRFATAESASPTVWVVEDLHWAGAPLLEMLEKIISRSTGPLILIGTARPEIAETHAGFGSGSENFSTLSLRPLSGAHSKELLESLLSAADLAPEMGADILGKAEGNPFFLEEIIRRLIDEGALVREGGRWRSTPRANTTPLPDSLLALLSARIDAIPPPEKRALQEAAVVGRVFWAEPLRRSLGIDDVSPALLALERRGLVSPRSASSLTGQVEYAFKHVLIRDVAYASLPKARRARAHAEVGVWLEEIAGDRIDEYRELLAYHFTTAVAGDDADLGWTVSEREPVRLKAFDHLLQAGAHARRRFASAKAVELHEDAVRIAAHQDERVRALEQLGDDHESAYQGEEARRAYLDALEVARSPLGVAADRARLCWKLAEMMSASPGAFKESPAPEPVQELVHDGLAHATDEETIARLLVAWGRSSRLYPPSDSSGGASPDPVPLSERIDAIEKARTIAERRNLPELLWIADSSMGLLYEMAGRYGEVLELARRELGMVDQLDSRNQKCDAVRRAAVATMNIAGRYEEGLELARRSLELSRDTNPHQLMHGTFPVMEALYELGRWGEVSTILDEHLQAFKQDPAVECQFVRDGPILGAVLAARTGRLDRARELGRLVGDPLSNLEDASAWQARLAVALGEPENGRLISGGKVQQQTRHAPDHARSLLEALIALEDWDELEKLIPVARARVPGLAVLGPCCDRAEGVLARARDDRAGSTAALEKAVAGFEALGTRTETDATRQIIAASAVGA